MIKTILGKYPHQKRYKAFSVEDTKRKLLLNHQILESVKEFIHKLIFANEYVYSLVAQLELRNKE